MVKKLGSEKWEDNRNMILESARQIVKEEGIDGISIRKIARLAGYTEGNIYNYFANKNQLITELVKESYAEILKVTMEVLGEDLSVKDEIIQRFQNYTKAAIKLGEYYKEIMLSDDPLILEITSLLSNASHRKPSGIDYLEHLIKKGIETGEFRPSDNKIMARVLWMANYGLTLRLIIEGHTKEDEVDALVREQVECVLQNQ